MEIIEAKARKEKLETDINNLIANFMEETGLAVVDLDVRTVTHRGNGRIIAQDTIVDVHIEFPS